MLKKGARGKFPGGGEWAGAVRLYMLFCTTTTRNIGLKIFESLFKLGCGIPLRVHRYIYIYKTKEGGEREKPPR